MKNVENVALLLLAAGVAEASWGPGFGGFDGLGNFPTADRFGHRRQLRQPQWQQPRQHHHFPQHQQRRRVPQQHQYPQQPHQQPYRLQEPPPPPPPPTPNANDDFTAAFLRHAGEDVILSSLELSDLVHVASGERAAPSRRSVLQILHQWDANRDGGLNLSEFLQMYAELQRQALSSFQQHWDNLRHAQAAAPSAEQSAAPPPPAPGPPPTTTPPPAPAATPRSPQAPPNMHMDQAVPPPQQHDARAAAEGATTGGLRPRRGKLNYVEKGERFFEWVFEDPDPEEGEGPLTVQTIVSTRIVGQTDSWAESEVW